MYSEEENSLDKKLLEKIVEMYKSGEISKKNAGILLKELENKSEDIAIIGIGCKTPVSDNYHDLWETMKNKKSHIKSCPTERMSLFADLMGENGMNDEYYHQGGLLSDMGMFDYKLFGITKDEAILLDPMQRVMLEVAYRTLEDGGYLGERKGTDNTGVFIGANFTIKQFTNYLTLLGQANFQTITANWTSGLATRISNIFDLQGVSTVVESSCVGPIIGIYDACNMLKSGKLKMALVGGINNILIPDKRISLNEVFEHGKDVVSRPYDDNPGGNYVGEGAAALLLKPLSHAIEEGDRILGVIKSCYVNNNGAKDFTQCNAEMIAEAVHKAFVEAKVNPEEVGYVEGEGYCEKLDQALEVIGLTQGFQKFTKRKQFCALGASSTNIGYSEVAVGMFNSICCILAMKHKQIPPIYCFDYPSEIIDFCNGPFYINDRLKEWKVEEGKKRISAIYTHGFGGGNGFTILEEPPILEASKAEEGIQHIFTISAQSKASFDQHIINYIQYLHEVDYNFSDICYTINVHRPQYVPYRLAIIASSKVELYERLLEWSKTRVTTDSVYYKAGKLKNQGQNRKHQKEIQHAVNQLQYDEIAKYYVDGYNILFSGLYSTKKAIVETPQYQFDKSLCWVR